MAGWWSLTQRRLEPEVMDRPDLAAACHLQALRGLERINRLSRSVDILWPAIAAYAAQVGPRPLRLLDLATGAGDVPLGLWRRARRSGLSLELEAWDISARALEYAAAKADRVGAGIRFARHDLLNDSILDSYDIIITSLFLHHLTDEQALGLLRVMGRAAQGMILVNDLVRCPAGLALAHVGSRLLSRSPVVHADAPRSVRAAFTLAEARALAAAAGLRQARVRPRWPKRFLLEWRCPDAPLRHPDS